MWDNGLQLSAQFWADQLAQKLIFHSPNNYGENLAIIGNNDSNDETFSF
jgi:hypothetical protein